MMIHDYSVHQITIDWGSNAGCEKNNTVLPHHEPFALLHVHAFDVHGRIR